MSIFGYGLSRDQRKVVLLSSVGGLLEFYDFTIYGLFAVYFASQFFPTNDTFISVIASYSIFVIGYIVRPLGGVIFSHIGDEIGRKTVLIITMALMGIASFGMALLPTYQQIGIFAPALMLLFRLIQGLAIGGELPSMIVYVSESMPDKRSFGMGGIFSGTVAGLIPGMLINLLIIHYLTPTQIYSFGWRIPFVLGGLLCFIAYRVRRELHETSAFIGLKQRDRFPLIELIQKHFSELLIGIGLVAVMATPIILLIIFMPTYLTKIVKISPQSSSDAIFIASCVSVISIYLMGILANKFDLYRLFRVSLVLLVVSGSVCYFMISRHFALALGLSVFAIFQGFLVTLPPILLSNLFPTGIRLSGVALAYNISFVFFGGVTPILITGLIDKTHMIYIVPVICLVITVMISWWALNHYEARFKNKIFE